MKNIHKALILSSAILVGNAQAEITFNGFASIVGGVTTSSDETLYGYDDSIDFSQGSLVALQVSSDLGDRLSVTAQILARGEDDWDPDFEWAYIAYDANDNLRILAGRQRVPFYMFSDFLDVSYAYAWIEPPKGVYDLSYSTFNGIGAIYTESLGEFDATLHITYGSNTSEINVSGESVKPTFSDLLGGSFTLVRDWLTLRAAYYQTEMEIPVIALQSISTAWNDAGFPDVADDVLVSGDTGKFTELGFQIDYENLLIIGEFTHLTLDGTTLSDQGSYYILAGYRFDNILAHITYGADEDNKDRITGGVPVGETSNLDSLINITNGLTNGNLEESKYVTLGLRWDFHDSAALKFEFTSFSDNNDSSKDAGLFRTALVTVF